MRRRPAAAVVVLLATLAGISPRPRRFRTGHPSGRRSRWPRVTSSFRPTRSRPSQRPAGDCRVASRAAIRQHQADGAAGGAQDPADKPGVASLAAALLDQGTTTRSAEQIAHTIDSIGGLIGSGSATEYTFFSDRDEGQLQSRAGHGLRHRENPAFVPQEIELQRKQMLSSMTVNYDDPDYLAGVVFERLVYGPHRHGRPDSGTPHRSPASPVTISSPFTAPGSARTTPSWPSSAT